MNVRQASINKDAISDSGGLTRRSSQPLPAVMTQFPSINHPLVVAYLGSGSGS